MIGFDLPGFGERLRMITRYLDLYILHPPPGAGQIKTRNIDEPLLRAVAEQTRGFSGREISKLAIAWQAAAYGTEGAELDDVLMLKVLEESKGSKSRKQGWLSKEEVNALARSVVNT
jgi:ATPase family AAA domain-containing protein 3A/B